MKREKVGLVRRVYRKVLYSDIDKIYKRHFDKKQRRMHNRKILDVGMGFGFDLIDAYRRGYDCYGIDFDKKRVEKTADMFAKFGMPATLRVGTATKIPFKNGTFDEVICSHVIEHVRDDKRCLTEMFRVLRKGGRLHLRVPNVHNLHTKFHMRIGAKIPYTDRTHLREYDRSHLVRLVEENGFRVKSVEHAGFFPPIGLKAYMIAEHFIPVHKPAKFLGEMFPKHSSEIKLEAVKA